MIRDAQILGLLQAPMTIKQLHSHVDASISTLKLRIRLLHAGGLVHVCKWEPVKSVLAAVYKSGPGVDADKPARPKIIRRRFADEAGAEMDEDDAKCCYGYPTQRIVSAATVPMRGGLRLSPMEWSLKQMEAK